MGGDHRINWDNNDWLKISIHTSVWEVTKELGALISEVEDISIHTSVWEVTAFSPFQQPDFQYFNPHLRMGGD